VKSATAAALGGWRRNGRDGCAREQGDLSGQESRAGVRALIVARKRRNGRGAKGGRKVDVAMDRSKEDKPAAVPKATRPGEVRARWAWTEPSVWTERMLTALEQGVKGGRWYSLMDKVCRPENLRRACARVKANKGSPGVDHVTVEAFERRLEANIERLSQSLADGTYRPQAIRRKWIEKAGKRGEYRPLGIPTIRDRVVQTALRQVIEPIFERDFAECSYGFRPNRGCKDALRRVDKLLRAGYVYVVDADVRGYFDNIPWEPLMGRVREKVIDGRVLTLIEMFLQQQILEDAKHWTPEKGSPQGAVISPLLANIYLDPLDHRMAEAGFEMVRYADDFVILCRTQNEAEAALARVRQWTEAAGLELHPEKTRLVNATERGGFDFLGYHFERGKRWPSKKSEKRLKDKIRAQTRRTHGHSLERKTIPELNRIIQGWFEYFKHGHYTTFPTLDGWIRMRLRSILRKRHGGRGRGRGRDHQRWPNVYFVELGLFSMTAARAAIGQSSRR